MVAQEPEGTTDPPDIPAADGPAEPAVQTAPVAAAEQTAIAVDEDAAALIEAGKAGQKPTLPNRP